MSAQAPQSWADMEDQSDDDYSSWAAGSMYTTSRSTQSQTSDVGDAIQEGDDEGEDEIEEVKHLPPQQLLARQLSAEEQADMEANVPRDFEGKVTSIGSIGHATRKCKPCQYFAMPRGCINGIQCPECHIPHKRKNKYRPCKGKRDRQKKKSAMQAEAGRAAADSSAGAPAGSAGDGAGTQSKMSL